MLRLKPVIWLLVPMLASLAFPLRAHGQARPGPGPIADSAARLIHETARQVVGDPDWSRAMALLAPGAQVRADRTDGVVRGTFVVADELSITIQLNGSQRRLMRDEVRRLAVASGTRQKRHANIGALAGAIVGAILIERHCDGQSTSSVCWEETMLYVGGPMMAGAAIGHWLPKGVAWQQIYVRRDSAKVPAAGGKIR
jgi:hypothetical protein